jgi:predicted amino acid-binding ACT domain protein
VAGPGEIVEMPQAEIDRLMTLGVLVAIDDQSAKGKQVKSLRPKTGVGSRTIRA